MNLRMPSELALLYRNSAQKVRVVSEGWGQANLYCPSCPSPKLESSPPNTPAIDFVCPRCDSPFQLKSQSRPLSRRLTDAAYASMYDAIINNKTPNLFALQYDSISWSVQTVLLVPSFAFSLSFIEVRKPLRTSARRSGWVGCNILIGDIPSDAKIPIIERGVISDSTAVRKQFKRLRPLEKEDHKLRGWTLDVLRVVRSLDKEDFDLHEVYAFEDMLSRLHPENRHVRPKLRQQLQRLRDLGLLRFLGGGRYRLTYYPGP